MDTDDLRAVEPQPNITYHEEHEGHEGHEEKIELTTDYADFADYFETGLQDLLGFFYHEAHEVFIKVKKAINY